MYRMSVIFALEEAADDIASRMRGFLARLPRAAVKSPASRT
jgi:hypothetical protein